MQTTKLMFYGTNEIVQLFTDDRVPTKLARQVALRLANGIPLVRRIIQSRQTEITTRNRLLPLLFRPW